MISLTARQQDALRFITGFQEAKGISPCRREIAEAIGCTSKASAQRMVDGLVDRGAIGVLRPRDRAIEVLCPIAVPRAPDGAPLLAVPLVSEDGQLRFSRIGKGI